MTKKITTYEELVKHTEELELVLQVQKNRMRADVQGLKTSFEPASHALSWMGRLFTRDRSNPIMATGANVLIDVVVRRLLLGRAGWFTKLVVPFLVKNYSSHVLGDNKTGLWRKVFSMFSKHRKNGHAKHELSTEGE
jgi:hypothetical protein